MEQLQEKVYTIAAELQQAKKSKHNLEGLINDSHPLVQEFAGQILTVVETKKQYVDTVADGHKDLNFGRTWYQAYREHDVSFYIGNYPLPESTELYIATKHAIELVYSGNNYKKLQEGNNPWVIYQLQMLEAGADLARDFVKKQYLEHEIEKFGDKQLISMIATCIWIISSVVVLADKLRHIKETELGLTTSPPLDLWFVPTVALTLYGLKQLMDSVYPSITEIKIIGTQKAKIARDILQGNPPKPKL